LWWLPLAVSRTGTRRQCRQDGVGWERVHVSDSTHEGGEMVVVVAAVEAEVRG